MDLKLIEKYNIPGPRYTSYPTVPYWDTENFNLEQWKQSVRNSFWDNGKEISIYIHLPFCESLCTYCGCTTHITKNHSWEERYMLAVLKEWEMYLEILPEKPILKALHLGGGTPTFFSPRNLEILIYQIKKNTQLSSDVDFSVECHPNQTSFQHLQALQSFGFNRVSIGIQDFDEEVQKAINRTQTYDQVYFLTETARNLGFESINYDLIYGLPKQTIETVTKSIEKTTFLNPDRIAFYGYAHIPWIKKAQLSLEADLPTAVERLEMYQRGKLLLNDAGYVDIGMDHFARPTDSLYKAVEKGALHRNFMGYTTQTTSLLVGLGMSAISDSWSCFTQNVKTVKEYIKLVDEKKQPILKGHNLTYMDSMLRKHILNLMCTYETNWEIDLEQIGLYLNYELLDELKADGIITFDEKALKITEKGIPFVRNVCMAFDGRMWSNKKNKDTPTFSKTL